MLGGMRGVLSFPNPVNEKAARVVAGVVLAIAIVTIATGAWWLAAVLAYGFVARTVSGPRLSPLGALAARVIAPRLGAPRPVPGPPKRFAQAIGALITTAAALAGVLAGDGTLAAVLIGLLIAAAALESLAAICIGCHLFALLMRAGVIPAAVCEECANVGRRGAAPA